MSLPQQTGRVFVSLLKQSVLCLSWTYQSVLCQVCCTWTACLQEPVVHLQKLVLHLLSSVYKSLCAALGLPVYMYKSQYCTYKSLCCTYACLSTRGFVIHLDIVCFYDPVPHLCVSVYKSFVLHLDNKKRTCLQDPVLLLFLSVYNNFALHRESCSAYKSSARAVFVGVRSTYSTYIRFGLFRNRNVCFGTCSKHRNKPKNYFSCFMKQIDNRNRLSLVLFCSNRKHFLFFSIKTQSRIFQIFGY
jgi:hypothetical protein